MRENRLKHARESRGLSQRALGKKRGIEHSAISKWENGTIPSEHLPWLSAELGYSVDYLIGASLARETQGSIGPLEALDIVKDYIIKAQGLEERLAAAQAEISLLRQHSEAQRVEDFDDAPNQSQDRQAEEPSDESGARRRRGDRRGRPQKFQYGLEKKNDQKPEAK